MKPTPPVTMWAVLAYNERIYAASVRRTRTESIATVTGEGWPWKRLYNRGWRCVQVEVSVL